MNRCEHNGFFVGLRFHDRCVFIVLLTGITLSFIVCIALYSYGFILTQELWAMGSRCIANQDFNCLLDAWTDRITNRDMLLALIGACLSVTGVVFGTLVVLIFKSMSLSQAKAKTDTLRQPTE